MEGARLRLNWCLRLHTQQHYMTVQSKAIEAARAKKAATPTADVRPRGLSASQRIKANRVCTCACTHACHSWAVSDPTCNPPLHRRRSPGTHGVRPQLHDSPSWTPRCPVWMSYWSTRSTNRPLGSRRRCSGCRMPLKSSPCPILHRAAVRAQPSCTAAAPVPPLQSGMQ